MKTLEIVLLLFVLPALSWMTQATAYAAVTTENTPPSMLIPPPPPPPPLPPPPIFTPPPKFPTPLPELMHLEITLDGVAVRWRHFLIVIRELWLYVDGERRRSAMPAYFNEDRTLNLLREYPPIPLGSEIALRGTTYWGVIESNTVRFEHIPELATPTLTQYGAHLLWQEIPEAQVFEVYKNDVFLTTTYWNGFWFRGWDVAVGDTFHVRALGFFEQYTVSNPVAFVMPPPPVFTLDGNWVRWGNYGSVSVYVNGVRAWLSQQWFMGANSMDLRWAYPHPTYGDSITMRLTDIPDAPFSDAVVLVAPPPNPPNLMLLGDRIFRAGFLDGISDFHLYVNGVRILSRFFWQNFQSSHNIHMLARLVLGGFTIYPGDEIQIRAVNNAGESELSNIVTYLPPPRSVVSPPMPILRITGDRLHWDELSPYIVHFALYVNHEAVTTIPAYPPFLKIEEWAVYGDRIQLRAYVEGKGYMRSWSNMVIRPFPAPPPEEVEVYIPEGNALFSPWFVAGLGVVTAGLLTTSVIMKRKGNC